MNLISIPGELMHDSRPFIQDAEDVKTYEKSLSLCNAFQLNIDWLLQNKFIKPTKNPVTSIFKRSKTHSGVSILFIGQYNEDGKPDGFVKYVNKYGYIYEGYYTPEGFKNGFGVYYDGSKDENDIWIGWRKKDVNGLIGNGHIVNSAKQFKSNEKGWFENGTAVADAKLEHPDYKYFSFDQVLSKKA